MPVAAFYNRPDINHVLVADLAPSQVCLAWDSSRHSALIREYVAIVLGLWQARLSAQLKHRRTSSQRG